MTPEQIMAAILDANREEIQRQAADAFAYGLGAAQTDKNGHVRNVTWDLYNHRPVLPPGCIEGEFRVVENG